MGRKCRDPETVRRRSVGDNWITGYPENGLTDWVTCDLGRGCTLCGSEIEGEPATGSVFAGFAFAPDHGPAPLSVAFSDLSGGDILAWAWDFGDGAASIEQNPTHLYTHPGVYHPSLYVVGSAGSDQIRAETPVIVTPIYTPVTAPWYRSPAVLVGAGFLGYVLYRAARSRRD